ncbi:hypothetical protein V8C86DRAFT_3148339 [Haematococcus lacustris]
MFRDGVQVTQPAHLWRPNQLQQGHVPPPPSSPAVILLEESSVSSLTFGPSLPLPLSPGSLAMAGSHVQLQPQPQPLPLPQPQPPIVHDVAGPSGVALLKEDALVYQNHQSSERNPRTMKQDQSQLKSFFSFFQTASAKGCFMDQLPVPPAIMEVVKAFVAGPLNTYEEMCARMYSWCSPPFVENLVVMFSLFSTHARNSKEKGEDGLGLKFSAQAFKHRFTHLAHCLKLYHSDLVLAKSPGVPSDWKPPPFCNEQDHLWRHVWKVTDGASKLAFKMGEVSVLRKRAALITPEAMDRAQPLMNPETPTGLLNLVLVQLGTVLQMRGKELHALEPKHFTKVVVADTPPGFKFVVDPFACKNHQGGLRGANNPPESKEVVPNSNTIRVGNQLAEAKSCPVVALDLLISKLPADAAGLFIKPNPAYEVSGKWYCNQKVGEHSLKNRVSSMFDTEEESFTSHSMKRTGATGVADFPDAFRQSMGGWADPGSMKSYTVHGTAKRGQATAAMMAAITPSDVAVNSSNATHVSASTVVAAHVGGGVEVSSTIAALPSPLPLSSPSSPAVATVPAPPPPPSPPSPPSPPMALPTSSPACGLSFTGQGIVHGASPLLFHAGAQSVVVPSAAQP